MKSYISLRLLNTIDIQVHVKSNGQDDLQVRKVKSNLNVAALWCKFERGIDRGHQTVVVIGKDYDYLLSAAAYVTMSCVTLERILTH